MTFCKMTSKNEGSLAICIKAPYRIRTDAASLEDWSAKPLTLMMHGGSSYLIIDRRSF